MLARRHIRLVLFVAVVAFGVLGTGPRTASAQISSVSSGCLGMNVNSPGLEVDRVRPLPMSPGAAIRFQEIP